MIAFYISGHGFGHASRDIEVINALIRQRPDVPVVVRSSVPGWLFRAAARRTIDIYPAETDSGVVQIDSLTLDEDETVRRAARFYEDFETRVNDEVTWLRSVGARVVVADVPPLACAAAARADVQSVVLANFTWDWIYRGFEGFEERAPRALEVITQAYATTTAALRLPFHGGFEAMSDVVRDIPTIARKSSHTRQSARAALGLDASRPVVLASFGGHGVRIPYAAAAADGRLTILLTEFESGGASEFESHPNLRSYSRDYMAAHHIRYEDFVAAADVVISKPGYGIVSECMANGAALLYTSRGGMIEYDIFVDEMPRVLRCRYIPQDDVLAGRWADAVDALLEQPDAPTRPMTNGAEIAAEFILKTAR